MAGIKIVTLADTAYVSYLKRLIKSISLNFHGASVHAVFVNTPKVSSDEIRSKFPFVTCEHEKVAFASEKQKKCYCTNRRGFLLRSLRASCDDILIWLDADSLIRQSCYELTDLIKSCDLATRPKTHSDPAKGFMGGLIVVGTSDLAKEFTIKYEAILENYSHKLVTPRNGQATYKKIWMSNQDRMYDAYKQVNGLKYKALPYKFLDTRFLPDGIIWSLKASTRNDPKFRVEATKYVW